jgi:hypothetical protein
MRMGSRWGRVARGWSAAVFATTVAAVSHTLAGGQAPSVFGVVASLVISGLVGTALAGSRLSAVRLAATMAISQLLFHGLFSSLGAPVTLTHSHAAMPVGLDAPAHHHDGTMWLAHAAAGLIAFLAYRFGEAAFFGLATTAALLLARLTRVLVPVVVTPSRVRVTPIGAQPSYLIPLLSSSVSRRGPPLGVAGA